MATVAETLTASLAEDLSAEMVSPSDARFIFISIDPERLGGAPCFRGTRVPVRYLFEYLAKGKDLATFLNDFDGVTCEQAVATLEL